MAAAFSRNTRDRCAEHGIDVERSYAGLQFEIRVGSPLVERLLLELNGYPRRNRIEYGERLNKDGSILRARPANKPLKLDPLDRPLTPEERAALELAASGVRHSAKDDPRRGATKTSLTKARAKLGAKTTTHAVAIALRQGLIPYPERKHGPTKAFTITPSPRRPES